MRIAVNATGDESSLPTVERKTSTMKSLDGRRIIDRILCARSRLRFERREAELFARMSAIKQSYQRLDPAIAELLRYYPIALVACVESYFRLAIRELIDAGEPYLDNSRHLLRREGFDFDILKGLHGETISIGELVSYHPSISSLGHIISLMETVMGGDFRRKVSDVYDRWKVEIKNEPRMPIILDIDETFRCVERTFQLRHIFCHETATAVEVESGEIDKCIGHTTTFLKASNELISQTLFPDAPLTQTDMNIASYEDYEKERGGLDLLVDTISEALSSEQKERFDAANAAWESFVHASVDIEGLEYEGGSIRPTIVNFAVAQFVRDRKIQLERLLASLEVGD